VKSRRGALLAAALAIAVAFAAVQIIRSQTQPVAGDIAATPAPPAAPTVATAPTLPTAPVAPAGEAAAPDAAAPEPTQAAAPPPSGAGEAAADAPADMASAPDAGATPAAPAGDDVAALAPAPDATSESPAAAMEAEPTPPELPEAIGSQRLRDAAQAGDPAAAFEVAARYAEGRGVLQDMRTAVAWYARAAETGLAPAQYRLGSIYEKGLGVPRDLVKAQAWYNRAAEAGNVKAMHNLAVLFAEGAGGEPDLERAADLFRRAAERGVRDSQFNLAILHARGLGVPQDLIEAYKWFSVAATSGDEEAARRRDIIAAALPEGDLAKAQAAAGAFEPVPLVSEANEVIMPEGGWSDTQDSTSVEAQPSAAEDQVGSVLSENDLVALVQKLLSDNGFDPGPADGLFGEQTMRAILDFQKQAGLPRTGQIDPGLVEALKGASG
jgi:localization factor PodJL